jgi:hypothetical protein
LDRALARSIHAHYPQAKGLYRGVKAATVLKAFDDTMGALRQIADYSNASCPVLLGQSELIKSERSALKNASHMQGTRPTPVVTPEDVASTVDSLVRKQKRGLAVHLIITWLTTARPPDVSKLLREDVTVTKNAQGKTELQVVFRNHKTTRKVPPYTLMTLIPDDWAEIVHSHLAWLDTLPKPYLCFPLDPSLARTATQVTYQRAQFGKRVIKEVQMFCSVAVQGSLRKSSLLAMAADVNVDRRTLLHFSRHRDENSLMIYLNLGSGEACVKEKMHRASKNLHPRRTGINTAPLATTRPAPPPPDESTQ